MKKLIILLIGIACPVFGATQDWVERRNQISAMVKSHREVEALILVENMLSPSNSEPGQKASFSEMKLDILCRMQRWEEAWIFSRTLQDDFQTEHTKLLEAFLKCRRGDWRAILSFDPIEQILGYYKRSGYTIDGRDLLEPTNQFGAIAVSLLLLTLESEFSAQISSGKPFGRMALDYRSYSPLVKLESGNCYVVARQFDRGISMIKEAKAKLRGEGKELASRCLARAELAKKVHERNSG